MRKIVIPYRLRQERGGHYNLIPLCDVRLHGRVRTVQVTAAVDSGAVYSFFPRSAAEDAGISLENARAFHVVFGGSEGMGKILPVYLNIHDRRFQAEVVFVDDLRLGYALLGRHQIFPKFKEVCFLESTPNRRAELRY